MGEMLERSADFLDAELELSVDRAIRLLEPLMMVVIGVLIGGIVMLMYLPIFELADNVGGVVRIQNFIALRPSWQAHFLNNLVVAEDCFTSHCSHLW